MRTLILILIALSAQAQDVATTITTQIKYNDGSGHTAGGDTWHFTAWGDPTYTITGGTCSANVAHITTSATHIVQVGHRVSITSASPSTYNVTYATVSARTNTTIDYTATCGSSAWTSGGTVKMGVPYTDKDGNSSVIPGNVIGTINDTLVASSSPCQNANIAIVQLVNLDMTSATNTSISAVNCMAGYGATAASNTPVGWLGACGPTPALTSPTIPCSWKAWSPWYNNGKLYVVVLRQDNGPEFVGYSSLVLCSADHGINWGNPLHAGCNADANGDAPAYIDSGAFNWIESVTSTSATMSRVLPIQYSQDNTISNPNVDGSAAYIYAITQDGSDKHIALASYAVGDNPQVTANWKYYTCSTYTAATPCDGIDRSNWSGTQSNMTPLANGWGILQSSGTKLNTPNPIGNIFGSLYAPDFHSYMAVGAVNFAASYVGSDSFVKFPHPWGPFSLSGMMPTQYVTGLGAPILATYTTLVAGHSARMVIGNNAGSIAGGTYTLYFQSADLAASAPRTGVSQLDHMGLRFSMGGAGKTAVPRKGLLWWFSCDDWLWPYAPGTSWAQVSCLENSSQYPTVALFNNTITTVAAYGVPITAAPGPNSQDAISGTATNIPSALTGDGTWTLSTVFFATALTGGQPSMGIGNGTSTFFLELGAAGGSAQTNAFLCWYSPSTICVRSADGTIATNNYYILTVTKTAGAVSVGAGGTVHMYLGAVEVPITITTGSGTPSVTASTLLAGSLSTDHMTGRISMEAAWNRVLTPQEVANLARAVKVAWARAPRSITLSGTF